MQIFSTTLTYDGWPKALRALIGPTGPCRDPLEEGHGLPGGAGVGRGARAVQVTAPQAELPARPPYVRTSNETAPIMKEKQVIEYLNHRCRHILIF